MDVYDLTTYTDAMDAAQSLDEGRFRVWWRQQSTRFHIAVLKLLGMLTSSGTYAELQHTLREKAREHERT